MDQILRIALLFVCLLLGSCSRQPALESGAAAEAKWLSTDRTRQVGMHVLLNRYPKAEIVSEVGAGQLWTYRFATNGVVLPVAVVVDRKAGTARFENVSR